MPVSMQEVAYHQALMRGEATKQARIGYFNAMKNYEHGNVYGNLTPALLDRI